MPNRTADYPGRPYAWAVVAILIATAVLSYTDRQVLSLLVDPVRAELGISDTQISLLLGTAFAVVYGLAGLPLGYLADRISRRNLIFVGVVVWSLGTIACGLSRSFAQLFAARIVVGLGEAALSPAAISLISDYFPPSRRGTAVGLFLSGIAMGSGAAILIGGGVLHLVESGVLGSTALAAYAGWRMVMLAIGGPGLLWALAILAIREPARRAAADVANAVGVPGVAKAVGVPVSAAGVTPRTPPRPATPWARIGPIYLMLAAASFVDNAVGAWAPTLLIRGFGKDAAQVGIVLGLLMTVGFGGGVVVGGMLADRAVRQGGSRRKLKLCVGVGLAILPLLLLMQAPQAGLVMAGVPAYFALSGIVTALGFSAILDVVPNRSRGLAMSVSFFLNVALGAGLGPTAVALAADHVFAAAAGMGPPIVLTAAGGYVVAVVGAWAAIAGSAAEPRVVRSAWLIALAVLGLALTCRQVAFADAATPAAAAASQTLAPAAALAAPTTTPVLVPVPSPQAIRRYRSGNVLWVIATAWGFVVPALIFFSGISARLRDLARRIQRRWYPSLVLYLVFLIVVVFLANLPLDYYSDFLRPHDYGLSSQSFTKWLKDEVVTLVIDVIGAALIVWIPFLLLKRSPNRWWLYSWIASVPILVIIAFVQPIWIDPLFNHFGPMHDKALEARILKLASRAGIEGASVYEVNKSVDTNMLNAYVTGVGSTKRIVLWDTTLKEITPDEVVVVVSHEMGHYALGHVWNGLIFESALLLAGLGFVHLSAGWILRHFGARTGVRELGDFASLPLFILLFNVVLFVLMPPLLAVSRHFEHEADRFALEMTHENGTCGTLVVKLIKHDLSYPNPSPLMVFFRASHPSLADRIDFCNTYHPWTQGGEERYSRYFKP